MEISAMMRNEGMLKKKEPANRAAQARSAASGQDEPAINDVVGSEKPWLSDPGFEKLTSMSDYIASKKSFARMDLYMLNLKYDSFRNELSKNHPELAAKHFSFSFDETGSIKILDPENNLSDDEKSWLAQSLSAFQGFGDLVSNILETVKTLSMYTPKTDDRAPHSTPSTELMDYSAMLKNNKLDEIIQHQMTLQSALPPSISEMA